jgi:hypothetical protein
MGLFHIATSCLRYFLHLLLALLDDEPSQGPLLGGFSQTAVDMVPAQNPVCHESEPSSLLPSSASQKFYAASVPPSKPTSHYPSRQSTLNAGALPDESLSKQQPYMPRPSNRGEESHQIEPSSSFTLRHPPCDLPILLNSELPPPSCTSMSISSRSSMLSTPIFPGWGPGTPMTPTRQPSRKASAGGGKLVGLGIQILYDDHGSSQFDGLGLVPSRMSESHAVEEEEDLGVPSRILLEEIYHTFTTPDALAAAAPFPEERDLADDETSVEDVFTARNITTQGPSATSTPRKVMKERGRLSYDLPTAASMRRARRMRRRDTEEGDESRSSDSSGSSGQKPVWRY